MGSASPADTGRRHPPSHVMDGLIGYIGDRGGGGRRSPAVATEVRVSHHGTVAAAVAVAEAAVAPAALLRGGSSTRIAASVAVAAAIAAAAVVLSEHGHGAVDAPVTAAGAVVAAPARVLAQVICFDLISWSPSEIVPSFYLSPAPCSHLTVLITSSTHSTGAIQTWALGLFLVFNRQLFTKTKTPQSIFLFFCKVIFLKKK